MNHSEYIKRRDEITHHPRLDEWEELDQAIDQLCLDVIGGGHDMTKQHFTEAKVVDGKVFYTELDVLQAQRAIIKGDK